MTACSPLCLLPSVFLNSVLLPSQCPHMIEVVFQLVLLMFGLPQWVSEVFLMSLFPWSPCGGCMSSAGVSGLSGPPSWLLSMLCSTTHINTMSLTTFGLCSIVVNSTLNHLTSIPNEFSTTLLPLDIL